MLLISVYQTERKRVLSPQGQSGEWGWKRDVYIRGLPATGQGESVTPGMWERSPQPCHWELQNFTLSFKLNIWHCVLCMQIRFSSYQDWIRSLWLMKLDSKYLNEKSGQQTPYSLAFTVILLSRINWFLHKISNLETMSFRMWSINHANSFKWRTILEVLGSAVGK